VKLDHRLDSGEALGVAPGSIRQPARVEVGVHRHVVTKTLGRGEQGSSSTCFTGLSAAFPLLTSRITARISLSANGASLCVIFGFFFRKARSAASDTIWRSSQSSLTAVSTAVPRSGSDNTLTTCGK